MSPRKASYRVPEWKVQLFKDQRKKVLFGPYVCPKCKLNTLKINVNHKKKEVTATCNCGINHSLNYVPIYDPVDYYNKLVDQLNR